MSIASQEKDSCQGCHNKFENCEHFINAFAFIGKKWSGLIISSLCSFTPMRFKDLANAVHTCSDRVLVERLKESEELKIVKRSVPDSGITIYKLTKKGAELKPILDQVHERTDRWEV